MKEHISAASNMVEPMKSLRERKLTPKMLELKQNEVSQRENKFIMLYESVKNQIRVIRTSLKDERSDKDLCNMMDAVEELETQVRDAYENICSQSAPSTEDRRNMDSSTAVIADLMKLMKFRMMELGQEEFNPEA